MTINDLTNCCEVTVEWSPDEGPSRQDTVYLPSRLLWSAKGMAELFRMSRGLLADPADHPGDSDVHDCWASFNIVSIEGMHGFVLDSDFDDNAEVAEDEKAGES